ncbi:hypothetical protein Dsin_014772 [Dipteronia sinensis]|uniref:Response regulatory domain-containing protein n=1 Tax=Dipteronia sinensis TaxID=43782 RepID=A0AAE0AMV5_9ROSI|nr:hypothetical protein Dsin_014772 [Dipteronia sinensis]
MFAQISIDKFRILVVDDDSTCLNLVSSMLKKWNYEVISANCPVHALATVQFRDIDLVVTDLHMPKMNGLELQKQIVRKYKLPVIIMSSNHKEAMLMKALACGVVFYMKKPVIPEDFKNIWQYAVASKTAKPSRNIERIESIRVENNSGSSMNKGKHGNKKDYKRKAHEKKKDDTEGENSIAPKKTKVVWTDALHNRFLQAIRYITLEKAVPKKIYEVMNVPELLTRDNVASHLQKYRLFLKRVADQKGFASRNSMTMDRTLKSSFASGYCNSLFNELEKQTSATSTPSFQSFKPIGFSSSNSSLTSSSWPPRYGFGHSSLLGGSTQANVHKPIYVSSTNPIYQPNHTGFGLGSNDIGTNFLSRGAMSSTNSMHTIATPSVMDFGKSGNSSYGTPSNSINEGTGTGNISFSFPNSNRNNNLGGQIMNGNNNNNASVFDNIADSQQFGQRVDMQTEPTNYQISYHKNQGDNENLTSELNGMLQAENAGLRNQGCDDDFVESLLSDFPF